jgi:hypothetical protein
MTYTASYTAPYTAMYRWVYTSPPYTPTLCGAGYTAYGCKVGIADSPSILLSRSG